MVDNIFIKEILQHLQDGNLSVDEALSKLRWQPIEAISDFAQIDHHRILRQGMPEFIYAEGKLPEQVAHIMSQMIARTGMALASRVTEEHYRAIQFQLPESIYCPTARLATFGAMPPMDGKTLVIAAGTSDLPVAEEAVGVLRFLGYAPQTLYDVGVSGIHRLLSHASLISEADVLIVIAGMEGALPTVIAGLVSTPVIAVPTSVGYGVSFGGIAALLGMLTSCATGLTVVNIDNGLGAAAAAHRILMNRPRILTQAEKNA
jgi:pyridinium-3,5-biscarboxylic acid mononucleotide synthase